jgi:hypothetical protein
VAVGFELVGDVCSGYAAAAVVVTAAAIFSELCYSGFADVARRGIQWLVCEDKEEWRT